MAEVGKDLLAIVSVEGGGGGWVVTDLLRNGRRTFAVEHAGRFCLRYKTFDVSLAVS
jgi:hypothetical protein